MNAHSSIRTSYRPWNFTNDVEFESFRRRAVLHTPSPVPLLRLEIFSRVMTTTLREFENVESLSLLIQERIKALHESLVRLDTILRSPRPSASAQPSPIQREVSDGLQVLLGSVLTTFDEFYKSMAALSQLREDAVDLRNRLSDSSVCEHVVESREDDWDMFYEWNVVEIPGPMMLMFQVLLGSHSRRTEGCVV